MLTQSEREWLINRDNHAEHFCRWCDAWETCQGELNAILCVSWTQKVQLREAAEFEGRVAEKMAQVAAMQKKHHCCVDIDIPFHCPGWQSCAERIMSRKDLRPCEFEMLKGVRIEVEEEMDGTD